MPVHPQIEPMLEAFAPFMSLDWSTVDVNMVRQAATQGEVTGLDIDVEAVEEQRIPTPEGGIGARLYRPSLEPGLPTVLFLHGGGWVMGTLDQYDAFCRLLARESGCAVLSVDYRLAPEHPYPAAPEDCYAALEWLAANSARLDLDGSRIAVAGDSAGGNLSAIVSLMARDRGGPAIRHQALLYPVIDRACDSVSFQENDRYLLTPDMMRWYWDMYVGDRTADHLPLAVPITAASLAKLPPATVLTAEYDPLRDEGEAYAAALVRSGVPTEAVRVPGMIHGFIALFGIIDDAIPWLRYIAKRLRIALQD
jgi:acetyl esterase